MLSIQLPIANASGLHARPAALFVRTAAAFRSDIRVRNVGRAVSAVNAKSILGVMGLGVGRGAVIEITTEGEDEAEALQALRQLVESGIGEGPGSVSGSVTSGGMPSGGVPPLAADA
jgi:phosphocarrier protein HPr